MIDFVKIEQYRENNCIEAKKTLVFFLKVFGKPTPPLANTYGGIIVLGVEETIIVAEDSIRNRKYKLKS